MELNHRLVNIPPSGIRRIGQLAKARPGCIALSIGEPDLDAPERIRRQIADAIVAGDTHYPPNAGISDLRGEIANAVNERFSTDYAPGETVVTIGSTEALASAIFAILNPGDEVIVPIPTFNLYQAQIEMAGGVFVPLPLRSDDFQIDAAALCQEPGQVQRAQQIADEKNGNIDQIVRHIAPPNLSRPRGPVPGALSVVIGEFADARSFLIIADFSDYSNENTRKCQLSEISHFHRLHSRSV